MTNPSKRRVALVLFVIALLSAVGIGAWRVQAKLAPVPPSAEVPLPVETVVVEPRQIAVARRYTGSVEANERAVLSARVTGTLQELPYREGEEVKAGALVARLDADELKAESARLQAAVARAKADLRFWEAQLARDEKLFAEGRLAARNRDESMRQVETTRAVLKEARQSHAAALARLGYSKLHAPFSGRVQRVAAELGELVTPGKAIIELVGGAEVKAVLAVPQADLPNLHIGAAARMSFVGAPPLTASVTRILPALNAGTRTGFIEVDLPPDGSLRPGMHVAAEVEYASLHDALSVPPHAVVRRNGENGVFLIRDGRARWQPVRERLIADSAVAVSGLTAGASVIVTPHPALRDGSEVGVHNDWRSAR